MEELEKNDAVSAESSTAEAQQTQEVASPETPVEQTLTPQPATESVNTPLHEAVDEFGVPYKNRYMEYKRKLEKAERERDEKYEQLLKAVQEKQQPQQYTKEQLLLFKEQAESANDKAWAELKLDELRRKEQESLIEEKFKAVSRQQEIATVRSQTESEVISKFPDAFIRTGTGVQWNPQSPLAQRIGYYLQDPEIANNPRGLKVAAAMAFADIAQTTMPKAQQTQQKLKAEVKNLQKKTLVEGSGQQEVNSVDTKKAALDKLRKTGSLKDANTAMGEILRKQGLLE